MVYLYGQEIIENLIKYDLIYLLNSDYININYSYINIKKVCNQEW